MKAMIFAAGLGTRLKPLTDTMPKAMVPVCGKPLLWHVLTKIRAAGFDDITVNVHHFASQIIDFLYNSHASDDCWRINVSDETDLLRETGGGIRHARQFLDGTEPFLVHNVDILSNLDLVEFAAAHQTRTVAALHRGEVSPLASLVVSERQTSRYLLFDDDMRLVGWTNVKTGEVKSPFKNLNPDSCRKLAFSGIHIMSPEVFKLMENASSLGWVTVPEKFSIIDFYLAAAGTHPIYGYVPEDFRMLDVGKLDSLAEAENFVGDFRQ